MQKGKGILAADESTATAGKRLASIQMVSTEETRRQYHEVFLAAEGIEMYLSGIILFDETIRQQASDGTPFPHVLERKGILTGIKVDKGLEKLAGHADETYAKGLEGLKERLAEYRTQGARFAKWRAAFSIGKHRPSVEAIHVNVEILARYAKLCQQAGLVPIIEPEVLFEGNHDIVQCESATNLVLRALFLALEGHGVDRSSVILKTSMVLAGSGSRRPSGPEEVGEATARMLRDAVPTDTAGVVFLSGGQTSMQATQNLNAIARRGPFPWPMTFSFARALQEPALGIWHGQPDHLAAARAVFLKRLKLDVLASFGKYREEMEKE